LNFYKHYLGDFQRDTGHLSLTERGAYLALIHHYYATENQLPTEHAALCRIAGAHTKVERDAVKSVTRFFEVRNGMLWHKRIEAELEKQVDRCDKNRAIAVAREERKRAELEAKNQHETSTNRAQYVPRNDHQKHTIPEPEPEPKPKPEEIQTHAFGIPEPEAPDGAARVGPTMAGAVCTALRAEGISAVNPSHPKLLALLEKGALLDIFIGAARAESTKKASKPFAYVLAVVEGQMLEAENTSAKALSARSPPLNRQEAIEEKNRSVAAEWLRKTQSVGAET
jgi:uncharacterized protein YdaU (DUF1376 family)